MMGYYWIFNIWFNCSLYKLNVLDVWLILLMPCTFYEGEYNAAPTYLSRISNTTPFTPWLVVIYDRNLNYPLGSLKYTQSFLCYTTNTDYFYLSYCNLSMPRIFSLSLLTKLLPNNHVLSERDFLETLNIFICWMVITNNYIIII
jgi:hypothetical protein